MARIKTIIHILRWTQVKWKSILCTAKSTFWKRWESCPQNVPRTPSGIPQYCWKISEIPSRTLCGNWQKKTLYMSNNPIYCRIKTWTLKVPSDNQIFNKNCFSSDFDHHTFPKEKTDKPRASVFQSHVHAAVESSCWRISLKPACSRLMQTQSRVIKPLVAMHICLFSSKGISNEDKVTL